MSPTSSSMFLVGRNARSATLRTITTSSESLGRAQARIASLSAGRAGSYARTRIAAKREPAAFICARRAHRVLACRAVRRVLAFTACCALAAAGCGGGERPDVADEPNATFDVQVVEAKFPRQQSLSQAEELLLRVRNTGEGTMPNVAVSIRGFFQRSEQPGLADPNRPVYVVERQPKDSETAYDQTWTLGPLAPGGTREFAWKVVPVVSGTHEIEYTVAAGLNGKAKARTSNGGRPGGTFTVEVADDPAQATVDPETGEVIRK